MDMFQQDEYGESSGQPEDPNVDIDITFDEVVKDLIQEKKTYIRELNMIIKVTSTNHFLCQQSSASAYNVILTSCWNAVQRILPIHCDCHGFVFQW